MQMTSGNWVSRWYATFPVSSFAAAPQKGPLLIKRLNAVHQHGVGEGQQSAFLRMANSSHEPHRTPLPPQGPQVFVLFFSPSPALLSHREAMTLSSSELPPGKPAGPGSGMSPGYPNGERSPGLCVFSPQD